MAVKAVIDKVNVSFAKSDKSANSDETKIQAIKKDVMSADPDMVREMKEKLEKDEEFIKLMDSYNKYTEIKRQTHDVAALAAPTNIDILSYIVSKSNYYDIHSDDKYPVISTQKSTEPSLPKDTSGMSINFFFYGLFTKDRQVRNFTFPQIIEFIQFLNLLQEVCDTVGFISMRDDFAFDNIAFAVPILQFFAKKNNVIYNILDNICFVKEPNEFIEKYKCLDPVKSKVAELCARIRELSGNDKPPSDINVALNEKILTLRGEQFKLIESISTRSFIESQAGGGDSSGYKNSKLKNYHIRRIHRKHKTNKKYTRKHSRKTHHKRTHRSRTPRKHKKYSRKH
jgi:hypothetical protein